MGHFSPKCTWTVLSQLAGAGLAPTFDGVGGTMSIKYKEETGIPSLYSKAGEARLESPTLPKPHGPRRNSAPGLSSIPSAAQGRRFRNAFSLDEARHNFIIETLSRPAWYKSRPYLYTCARCKWAFRVNDFPGSIIPLDPDGRALPEPARSWRIGTFAQGPCGAFAALAGRRDTQARRPSWIRRTLAAILYPAS